MPDDARATAFARFSDAACAPQFAHTLGVIERCATDPPLVISTLLDAVRPLATPGSRIIELGIGPGWLLPELRREFPGARVCGLDLAPDFVRAAHTASGGTVDGVVGDMERLPFRDASVHAIVTAWTLYFMRDIDAALAGMRRCLAPGGVFVAATNAPDHMREYESLAADAVREACGIEPEPDVDDAFNVASGLAPMQRAFGNVEVREFRGTLTVPDVETALELWPTYAPWHLTPDEDARSRAAFGEAMGARLAAGPFVVTRHGGVFVARA